jgi:hypothetical protein
MASNASHSEMGSELDVEGEDKEGSYYPPPFYDIPNLSAISKKVKRKEN